MIGFNACINFDHAVLHQRPRGEGAVGSLDVWVGACATAPVIAMFVFSPLWGQLADSYGKRAMLLRALIGGVVVIGLMAVVNRPWQLLVLRGLQGALTGTITAATVLVATMAEKLGYTLGLLQTGHLRRLVAGSVLGGLLSDLLGYRITFLITAGSSWRRRRLLHPFRQAKPGALHRCRIFPEVRDSRLFSLWRTLPGSSRCYSSPEGCRSQAAPSPPSCRSSSSPFPRRQPGSPP